MSIPKSNIWQELRGECLDAIPSNCRTDIARPVTLALWRTNGYYHVLGSTKKRFDLRTSSSDFGSALLTDAECCLDHAAEHQVSLWRNINSQEWLSPAWLAVTLYYWSFFLTLAMTRLTGKTAWYLTKDVVRDLSKLSPNSTASPGGGCFKLLCGSPTGMPDREIVLQKSESRIHDEIWQLWFNACSSKSSRLSINSSNHLEERLFTALATSAKNLGSDWPSVFRNAVNYRPGFAYTAVRKERVLKSFGYLKKPRTYDVIDIVDRFENSVVAARTPSAIMQTPQTVLELLVDFTFLIHALTSELHRELIDRHGLDRRWRAGRQRFLRANGIIDADGDWPI